MITILITASVLCSVAPVQTVRMYSTMYELEQNVQLIRRGWYNPETNGRCKAVKVNFVTIRG